MSSTWQLEEKLKEFDSKWDSETNLAPVILLIHRITVKCIAKSQICCETAMKLIERSKLLEFLQTVDHADPIGRQQVLNLLIDIAQSRQNHVQLPLGTSKACFYVLQRDTASSMRCSAAKVMTKLVKQAKVTYEAIEGGAVTEWLMHELKFNKKTGITLKDAELKLLTHLFLLIQDKQNVEPFLEWIRMELQRSATELKVVTRAFTSLGALEPIAQSHFERHASQYLSYIRGSLNATDQLKQYKLIKAALFLLKALCPYVRAEMAHCGPELYERVIECCISENRTLRKNSFTCIERLLETIAELVEKSKNKRLFNHFIKLFLPLLSNIMEPGIKIDMAVKGLGYFAPSMHYFSGESIIHQVLSKLEYYSEQVSDISLAGAMWSYSRLLEQIEVDNIDFLVTGLARLVELYQWATNVDRYFISRAILQGFRSAPDVIHPIVHETLLKALSNRLTSYSSRTILFHPDTGLPETRLLFEYLNLFKQLLFPSVVGVSEDESLSKIIYHEIMANLAMILNRLNIGYNLDENAELQPIVPRDHTILLNLMDFIDRLIQQSQKDWYLPWGNLLFGDVVRKSHEFPLVSSFYRLAATLTVCDCDFRDFFIHVCTRAKYYKDELLFSCFKFLFNVPVDSISWPKFIPVIQSALKMGVSHVQTANVVIAALERYLEQIPDTLSPCLNQIVPFMEPYVQMNQRRMIRFLGRIGHHNSILAEPNDMMENAIRWSAKDQLILKNLTLGSEKMVEISLDDLIPRLSYLASYHMDRQTKAAASETLHAVVLILCGRTATTPLGRAEYHNLWVQMFPILLRLATDGDKITRTLFEPLMIQLIRWFGTGRTEAPVVLEALGDGLAQPENDFCAKCLAEYFKVCQSRGLFDRLFRLTQHPSTARRIGASKTLDYMSTHFGQDETLVSTYSLALLKYYLEAMRLADYDPPDVHSVEKTTDSVNRIEGIILQNANRLVMHDMHRIVFPDLRACTEWLITQLSRKEKALRRKCRDLIKAFSPLLNSSPTLEENVLQILERSEVALVESFSLVPTERLLQRIDLPAVVTKCSEDFDSICRFLCEIYHPGIYLPSVFFKQIAKLILHSYSDDVFRLCTKLKDNQDLCREIQSVLSASEEWRTTAYLQRCCSIHDIGFSSTGIKSELLKVVENIKCVLGETTSISPDDTEFISCAIQTAIRFGWYPVEFIVQHPRFWALPELLSVCPSVLAQHNKRFLLHIVRQAIGLSETKLESFVKDLVPLLTDAPSIPLLSSSLKLFARCSPVFLEQSQEVLDAIRSKLFALLASKETSLQKKAQVIDLIPFLTPDALSGQPLYKNCGGIRQALQFLTLSDLLTKRLLIALGQSASVQALSAVLRVFEHSSRDISKCLDNFSRTIMKSTDDQSKKSTIAGLIGIIIDGGSSISVVRSKLCRVVAKIISLDLLSKPSLRQLVETVRTGSVNAIGFAFLILRQLYQGLDASEIRTSLPTLYYGRDTNAITLTIEICKKAGAIVKSKDSIPFEVGQKAYEFLLVAITKTQSKERVFTQTLFDGINWTNVIDQTKISEWRSNPEKSEGGAKRSGGANQLATLQSQFLMSSSLMTEQFSFTQSATTDASEQPEEVQEKSISGITPLVDTLRKMHSLFHITWTEAPPTWMQVLLDVYRSGSLYTQSFFIQLILTAPDIFEPYAKYWVDLITTSLMEWVEFDSLLKDSCRLLLSFKVMPSRAGDLINSLLLLIPHKRARYMRDNLEVVGELVDAWKNSIVIDQSTLFRSNAIAGLYIVPILLKTTSMVSQEIVNAVLELLSNGSRKATVDLASEVIGMLVENRNVSIERVVADALQLNGDLKRYMSTLRNITKHSRVVIATQSVFKTFLSQLPNALLKSETANLSTTILCDAAPEKTATKEYATMFEMLRPYLKAILRHSDVATQKNGLTILLRYLPSTQTPLDPFVTNGNPENLIEIFESHTDVDCRVLYYNVIFYIDETMRQYHRHLFATVKDSIINTLLRGLTDSSREIRDKLYTYWNLRVQPLNGPDRLRELMNGELNPMGREDSWCHYSARFLLASINDTMLFDRPLGGSYEPLLVDPSWEVKTQTMKPLFSQDMDAITTQCQMNETIARTAQEEEESEVEHDRRPGVKADSKTFFRQRALRLRKARAAQVARNKKARFQKVQMYRSYRQGDFPDIQIKLSDLCKPLMALAEVDIITARLIFSKFFTALSTDNEYLPQLSLYLEKGKKSQPFISVLHDVLLKNMSLVRDIDPRAVCESTVHSLNLKSGQLILERKKKTDELYHLLNRMADEQMIVALSHQGEGLKAEIGRDYATAVKMYRQQLSTEQRGVKFGYSRCLLKLNQWDTLLTTEPSLLSQEETSLVALLQNKQNDIRLSVPLHQAIQYTRQGDVTLAKGQIEESYGRFISNWASLHPFATSARAQELTNLINTTQLDDFLTLPPNDFSKRWRTVTPPINTNYVYAWPLYLATRLCCRNDPKLIADTLLNYAEYAVESGVLPLAKSYLSKYQKYCRAEDLPYLNLKLIQVYVQHVFKVSQVRQSPKYTSAVEMFQSPQIQAMTETMQKTERVEIQAIHGTVLWKAGKIDESFAIFQSLLDSSTPSAKVCVKFADFLYKRMETDSTIQPLFLRTVLGGMALGSHEAAFYLPKVLNLITNDEMGRLFTQYMKPVPTWTCLEWTAQFLANKHPAVSDYFRQIAQDYPNAVYYDCKVADYAIQPDRVKDSFVQALEGLYDPEYRLRDGMKQVLDKLKQGKQVEAQQALDFILKDVFTTEDSGLGKYNLIFARTYRSDVEAMVKNLTIESIQKVLEWINTALVPKMKSADRIVRLSEYSDWLNDTMVPNSIELPGAYQLTEWKCPDPSYHPRLVTCDPDVYILPSKVRPKRLSFHCSDEKTRRFLVKGGEDLRLDQRMMQLFHVMNRIVRPHGSLTTYQVIPMTKRLGLIEWLEDCTTFTKIFDPKSRIRGYQMFDAFFRGNYVDKAATSSKDEIVALLTQAEGTVGENILVDHFLHMTTSPEAFFHLRREFLSSLCAFNCCSYISGVGDRHLDNLMLNTKNGAVIGIDYGLSFGSGLTDLPLPELIPFRLTKQFQQVAEPYNATELLVDLSYSILSALRKNQTQLLNMMQVFITEPLLDWRVPKHRIQMAQHKLQGYHPVKIVQEELQQNSFPSVQQHQKAFTRIVQDACSLHDPILSVDQQIKCLIEIATDPNILGRTFKGWSPWM